MTVSWCGASSKRRRRRAGSSFPIPRKRSPGRARCSRRVLARDKKGTLRPLDVRTGDRVLFDKWSGTEIKIDGEGLVVMKESDIMGVIEDVAARSKSMAA
jgi:hypothetical protein